VDKARSASLRNFALPPNGGVGKVAFVWSGHSCPQPLTLGLVLIFWMIKVKIKVKIKTKIKNEIRVSTNIKRSGQECPLYTGIHSHL
jgi:hypothetical protein